MVTMALLGRRLECTISRSSNNKLRKRKYRCDQESDNGVSWASSQRTCGSLSSEGSSCDVEV